MNLDHIQIVGELGERDKGGEWEGEREGSGEREGWREGKRWGEWTSHLYKHTFSCRSLDEIGRRDASLSSS